MERMLFIFLGYNQKYLLGCHNDAIIFYNLLESQNLTLMSSNNKINQDKFKDIFLIKIIRGIIMFLSIYFIMKYFTVGKIPYNEIIMIASASVLIQILLDIYRPLIILY